jgi:ATP phosphoribosyltransferase regulatory subunit
MGQPDILSKARQVLAGAPPIVLRKLDELALFAERVSAHCAAEIRIDVAELSGYGYHNGAVFAVYHPEHGRALAQGGRYDGVGEAFGRARAATGFDMNLKQLLMSSIGQGKVIFAPLPAQQELHAAQRKQVEALRESGLRVVNGLSEDELVPSGCSHQLSYVDGQWQVVKI